LYGRKLRLGYAQHHAKVDSESILKTRINSLYFRFLSINGVTDEEEVMSIFLALGTGNTIPEDRLAALPQSILENETQEAEGAQVVTEVRIRDIFHACGQINDVSIRRVVSEKGIKRGYGFIHFNDILGVIYALENMKKVFVDNILFILEPSKNLQQQLQAFEAQQNGGVAPSGSGVGAADAAPAPAPLSKTASKKQLKAQQHAAQQQHMHMHGHGQQQQQHYGPGGKKGQHMHMQQQHGHYGVPGAHMHMPPRGGGGRGRGYPAHQHQHQQYQGHLGIGAPMSAPMAAHARGLPSYQQQMQHQQMLMQQQQMQHKQKHGAPVAGRGAGKQQQMHGMYADYSGGYQGHLMPQPARPMPGLPRPPSPSLGGAGRGVDQLDNGPMFDNFMYAMSTSPRQSPTPPPVGVPSSVFANLLEHDESSLSEGLARASLSDASLTSNDRNSDASTSNSLLLSLLSNPSPSDGLSADSPAFDSMGGGVTERGLGTPSPTFETGNSRMQFYLSQGLGQGAGSLPPRGSAGSALLGGAGFASTDGAGGSQSLYGQHNQHQNNAQSRSGQYLGNQSSSPLF
jgi:hypothetical protein